jgi:hypothetical protein
MAFDFIDANLIRLIAGLFVAICAAVVYTIVLKFKDDPAISQPIQWANLGANVIFGIAIGVVAWLSGITVTIDWLGGQIAAYGVIIALLDHIITGIINRTYAKPQFTFRNKQGVLIKNPAPATNRVSFLAGAIATMRKMDPESRHFLIFDLPDWAKQPVLNCVDQAELKNQFQYAIQAQNWVFLIEDGELTGAKHFWTWFGWSGSGNVMWKPISPATLEAIRQTGRFPDYSVLV